MFKRRLEKHLTSWKTKPNRKPLIVRGARQVGKTSLLKKFGKEQFDDFIYINLENHAHSRYFKNDISIKDFEQIIKINFEKNLTDNKTLLILDEIQNVPSIVKLLRFFYEERPNLHIIAAGSLLEAKMHNKGFSLPVGRVEFAYLYPLDFFEFLEAMGHHSILEYLKKHNLKEKILDSIHQKALELFGEYSMIGGMPEIVKAYSQNTSISDIKNIFSGIITTYIDDLYKYSSLEKTKYLQHVLENSPKFSGEIISYQNFSGSNYKYREMFEAFTVLEKVFLLKLLPASNSKLLPLIGKQKRPKKLIFLDVGFANYYMDLFETYISSSSIIEDMHRGRIAEQIVGQNIIAQYQTRIPNLLYWAKEKRKGSAEVDFAFTYNGKICGIEVKSGQKRNLKSLGIFNNEVKNSKSLRLYSGNIELNEKYISLPLYLVGRIMEVL